MRPSTISSPLFGSPVCGLRPSLTNTRTLPDGQRRSKPRR